MVFVKKCSQCSSEKDINEFNKDKSSTDGHRANCKECCKAYRERTKDKSKEYRESIKDIRSQQFKIWYQENKDRKKAINSKYYEKNKDKVLKKVASYYENNKEKKIEYQKEYQLKNKEKRNFQFVERRKNDPLFRFITNIRNLINNSFYQTGFQKNSKTQEILGCSYDELKLHLESKFEYWMNWENKGNYNGEFNFGWDIDHIIPLSTAKNLKQLVKLNHFTNLQPLCSKINRDIKKDKLEYAIL